MAGGDSDIVFFSEIRSEYIWKRIEFALLKKIKMMKRKLINKIDLNRWRHESSHESRQFKLRLRQARHFQQARRWRIKTRSFYLFIHPEIEAFEEFFYGKILRLSCESVCFVALCDNKAGRTNTMRMLDILLRYFSATACWCDVKRKKNWMNYKFLKFRFFSVNWCKF